MDRAARYVETEGPARVLDVGCGTGEFIRRLLFKLPEATFVGVDPAFGMVTQAQRKFPSNTSEVEFLRAPAEHLPFQDRTFDWVTCCSCLHCLPEPQAALREMTRVLKFQGRILVMDWCRDSYLCRVANLWCHWFDPTHVWMYTVPEIRRMLEESGVNVTHVDRFRVPWPGRLKLWEMMLGLGVKK